MSEPAAPKTSSPALLQGKVALITGGARGIGLAIPRSFGNAGARLVINDLGCDPTGNGRDPGVVQAAAAELTALGFTVTASAHDISDSGQVAELFAQTTAEAGGVDILDNAAGILRDRSIFDLTEEDWDEVQKTHLRGAFLCTQSFARHVRKARTGGSILNMTSVSGLLGNVGQLGESSDKAGVYGLTRTSSIELQKYGVTVNDIAAIARTRLTEDLPIFEKVGASMEPEHVAPVALYLVSELAEGLSGTVLSVAGGGIATIALTESRGRIKESEGGLWTAEEIAENFTSISRA